MLSACHKTSERGHISDNQAISSSCFSQPYPNRRHREAKLQTPRKAFAIVRSRNHISFHFHPFHQLSNSETGRKLSVGLAPSALSFFPPNNPFSRTPAMICSCIFFLAASIVPSTNQLKMILHDVSICSLSIKRPRPVSWCSSLGWIV